MNAENKQYNPFKMWGSWIGGVIGAISLFFGGGLLGVFVLSVFNVCKGEFCDNTFRSSSMEIFVFLIIQFTIFFLIGWGIHSLIRRFRK